MLECELHFYLYFLALILMRSLSILFLLTLGFSTFTFAASLIPAPPQLAATGYLLIDADTGKIIVEHNADEQLPPASLTKMMTSYVIASELEQGNMAKNDRVRISEKAWRKGGSKMFVEVNTEVPLIDLLRGVIVQSGNDASIALAEHAAGSEDAFADIMNQQALLLGMQQSHFKNATGWPAEGHVTTARDLSKLARALINDHPEHYAIYSEKYFTYNEIKQPNRNRLLWRDDNIDGIKTGHTDEAGFCLVSSAKKNNMRLISVVMGTTSETARANESQKLLAFGFRYYESLKLYDNQPILKTQRVWGGNIETVDIGLTNALHLTIPRNSKKQLQAQIEVEKVLKAPITKGQVLGHVVISLEGETLMRTAVVAQQAIDEAGLMARIADEIELFVQQNLGKL